MQTMKVAFKEFKVIINFLLVFILAFFVLSICYDFYLNNSGEEVDGMSAFVAQQAADLLQFMGYKASIINPMGDKSSHLLIDGLARVKVIEGCNGLAVMILFVAFLLAFPGKLKTKLWYISVGLLLIYFFNVVRIATLGWTVFRFANAGYSIYKEMFTVSIYFLVLLLWYFWVNKFGVVQHTAR